MKLPCTLKLRHTGSPNPGGGDMNAISLKYKQSMKSQKPFAENGEAQALSSGCHDSAVAYGINPQGGGMNPCDLELGETQAVCHQGGVMQVREQSEAGGFKAGQSANGSLGDEREVSPTLTHAPSALEPTVDIATLLSQMRYIVRRLTPKECERLQGIPDGHTIPTGLRRFFDADGAPSPSLVAEFQRIFDAYNAIMHDYARADWERKGRKGKEPKPPKPKSAKQVAAWLAKISAPATCPDSPQYKALGNGQATNQPRWITMRILAIGEGIDPFTGEKLDEEKN